MYVYSRAGGCLLFFVYVYVCVCMCVYVEGMDLWRLYSTVIVCDRHLLQQTGSHYK